MNTAAHSGITSRFWVWMSLAWLLILAKCIAVPMVINHWHVPIASSWVVLPTLTLAIVATILILTRFHFGEPKG
jgi:hypothetical protein